MVGKKLVLDGNRLLGFRLYDHAERSSIKSGSKDGAKLGAKLGAKQGLKSR